MIILTDADILRAAESADLLGAIDFAFQSSLEMPARLQCNLPGQDRPKLLVMPGWDCQDAGVKVATVTEHNRARGLPTFHGVYLLFDGDTGQAVAMLAGRALTELRTAAVSALASRYLSRPDSRTMLFIGTGSLAPFLIRAHVAVRSLEHVLVWGRNRSKAVVVVEQLADLPCKLSVASDLAVAIPQADIISAATSSKIALIQSALVRAGTHVDLVGSFTPNMHEAESALFARSRLVVDTRLAFEESGDLISAVALGLVTPTTTKTLRDIATARSSARRSASEITVFKSVGTAVADLAVAKLIVDSQKKRGRSGLKLDKI